MAGKLNPNRVKIHRNYTVEEIAALFSVHKNTVRSWFKKGFPVLDDQKPMLILGRELKSYLQASHKQKKRKCRPDEMYCMRCKSPRKPAENMVDYVPISVTTGRLVGLCSSCESIINKITSFESVERNPDLFDITFPSAQKHINKIDHLLLNSDLSR